MAQQVRQHERAGGQTTQGAGGREHGIEEAAGQAVVQERRHQERPAKKVVTAPAHRKVVRHLIECGLTQRRSLVVVPMNASALRYVPLPCSQRRAARADPGAGAYRDLTTGVQRRTTEEVLGGLASAAAKVATMKPAL